MSDYTKRTVDYGILHKLQPGALALVGADGRGRVLTGIFKLAQRFIMTLLTRAGSKTYLPADGCSFMLDAVIGSWRTVADVQQSFNVSLPDVRQQLRSLERRSDAPDERFGSAQLLTVELRLASLVLTVQLVSMAGSDITVIMPVATIPQ